MTAYAKTLEQTIIEELLKQVDVEKLVDKLRPQLEARLEEAILTMFSVDQLADEMWDNFDTSAISKAIQKKMLQGLR